MVLGAVPFAAAGAAVAVVLDSTLLDFLTGLCMPRSAAAAAVASASVANEDITASASAAAYATRLTLGSRLILRPWTCTGTQKLQYNAFEAYTREMALGASHTAVLTYDRAVACSAPVWFF